MAACAPKIMNVIRSWIISAEATRGVRLKGSRVSGCARGWVLYALAFVAAIPIAVEGGNETRRCFVVSRSLSERILVFLLAASLLVACSMAAPVQHDPTLTQAYEVIKSKKFVDLTHAFAPGIPHWPGFPDEKRKTLYWYEPGVGTMGKGFFAQEFTHVGQWGTHVDPPAHFVEGLRTIDQIDVREMILPLVVIDVHENVEEKPDYTVTMDDVRVWESKHGLIPGCAFVALRTDWSKRWPDVAAMQNRDPNGVAHYPGWSMAVLKYLYEERRITACGHETTDTDPGTATSKGDYSLETYVLGTNHYQVELLTNLDQVPEAGALVVVSFPKPKGGSGFPARVFAILP